MTRGKSWGVSVWPGSLGSARLCFYWPSRDFHAEDEQGRKLLPAPGEATREVPATGGGCAVELPVRWQFVGSPGQMVRAVRGNVVAVFPGPTTQVIIPLGRPSVESRQEGELQVAFRTRLARERGYEIAAPRAVSAALHKLRVSSYLAGRLCSAYCYQVAARWSPLRASW